MPSPFVRVTTAGRQRSKTFACSIPPTPPFPSPLLLQTVNNGRSHFTRTSTSLARRQRSKRFARREGTSFRRPLVPDSGSQSPPPRLSTSHTSTLPSNLPAPSPPLLSNESAASLLLDSLPAQTQPGLRITPRSPFTRNGVTSTHRQRSKRLVSRAEQGLPPLLIREFHAHSHLSQPLPASAPPPTSAPAPSPLLLSTESAAHRFSEIPHSILFPVFRTPAPRPNTDPRANTVPSSLTARLPSVTTPLRCSAWEYCLREYPDRSFVNSLLHIIDHGCDIGFIGDRTIYQTSTNLRSAFEHPDAVSDTISTQLSAGRLAGPYIEPPFPHSRISPLGVAVRKQSGKLRQIHHLSWPRGHSVNDGIPDSEASIAYDMLAKSIDDLRASGPGSLMIKFDLEAAFRHIPIRHADLPLLGYSWRGSIYYELFLMFGLRSAPYIFNLFAEALHWILQRHIPSWLRHYLDDFLLIFRPSTPPWIVHAALTWLRGLVSFLGLSLQDKKTEGPSTCLEMLGIELDSVAMEARLPPNKIAYLNDILRLWRTKTHCTLRELQEFSGYLIFCSQVIPHSRAFIQSLFDFSSSFTSPYARRRLTRATRRDILWWSAFATSWNGIHILSPTRANAHIFTDASGSKGAGGVYQTRWFSIRIPRRYAARDIKFKELFAVVHALLCWGPDLSGSHVTFHIDNTNAFHAINNLSIKSAPTMQLLRQFLFLCARFDIAFTPVWIPSEDNPLADAASRFQYTRLFELDPLLSPKPSCKVLSLALHTTSDPSISRPVS